MKNENLISDKLKSFISEVTFTNKEKIKENTLIFEEGIFDSLGFLSLINFLNEEFNIDVEDNDLIESNFESIEAIIAFVNSKRRNN